MQITGLPSKFGVPFADAAGSNYIRPIPQASQIGIQPGAASLTDGFPPVTFLPVAAGGTPPFGQDFNGLLNQITAWVRALTAGMVVPFDAGFQAAIGGYPFKARVLSGVTAGLIWESQIDNNLSNPDTGGANWSVPVFVDPSTAGLIIGAGPNGSNIRLQGTGAAPNKTIRASGGNFQILNNAYAAILDMTDAGIATTNGMRAAIGAFGSGDSIRVPNLSDFAWNPASPGYQRLPNGFIIQWGRFVSVTGNADVFNWPTAFPTGPLMIVGCDDGSQIASAGFNFIGAAQVRMWCGFQNNGTPIYTTGTGILWIAVGY